MTVITERANPRTGKAEIITSDDAGQRSKTRDDSLPEVRRGSVSFRIFDENLAMHRVRKPIRPRSVCLDETRPHARHFHRLRPHARRILEAASRDRYDA